MGVYGDWAERYSEYNLAVFPCYGKKPSITEWSKYCDEKPTDEEINAWIKSYSSNTAIGLPLGKANELIAFDFDYAWPDDPKNEPKGITREEFEIERKEIENALISMLPNSPCKKVGKPGKWTAFFRPNGIAKTFRADRRGIRVFDVLYDGTQTILPPSIHPDTKKPYEWVGKDIISSLDILPELTLNKIEEYATKIFLPKNKEAGEKTTSGRNDILKSAAYGLFKRGLTPEASAPHLVDIDKDKNQPPLFSDKSEFSTLYKTPEKAALKFAKSNYKTFKSNVFKEPNHAAASPEEAKEPEQIGFYYLYLIPRDDGGVKKVYVPQYELMADDSFDKKQMCFDDSQSLLYNGKHWDWMSKNHLNNYIWTNNTSVIKPAHIDSFAKSIRSRCHITAFNFKDTTAKINCNNVIVDVKTGAIEPHSYSYLYKYCLPVDYTKDAKHPEWDKFLKEIFCGDQELIDLMQLIFGYVLIGGDPFLHRAFVLYGTGRNGKSTLLDVLRALVGHGSYSTVSMAKLDREFSIVTLDGKLANIVEETPTDEINAEVFKAMVGGGEVQAAHKGFEEFTLRVQARFLFACNEMPVFKDKSIGLSDRLVFIPFEKYFEEGERDTSIKQKLMAELSGILTWAIEGAKKIAKEKKLNVPKKCTDTKEIYRRESDSIYAWFNEKIRVDAEGEGIELSDLYDRYVEWTSEEGHKPYGKNKFSKRLKALIETECSKSGIKIIESFGKFYKGPIQFRGYKFIFYK